MVDVVNSSLAGTQLLRADAGSRSVVSNATDNVASQALTESVSSGPQAPYVSLFISVDYDFDTAVIQVRDSATGDVEDQFPTESRLVELRRAQSQAELSRQRTESVDAQVSVDQSSAPIDVGGETPISSEIITVQEVTSSAPVANTQQVTPQIAVATLSAGVQSTQTTSSVSVLT